MLASRLGWLIAVMSMVILGYRLIAREESELFNHKARGSSRTAIQCRGFFVALAAIPASGAARNGSRRWAAKRISGHSPSA